MVIELQFRKPLKQHRGLPDSSLSFSINGWKGEVNGGTITNPAKCRFNLVQMSKTKFLIGCVAVFCFFSGGSDGWIKRSTERSTIAFYAVRLIVVIVWYAIMWQKWSWLVSRRRISCMLSYNCSISIWIRPIKYLCCLL